jgi:predicted nuclease of predicted toxin-antitoxin system
VKLLFDENLSPKLARRLASLFIDSRHVHDCGLGASDDSQIWQYAAANDYILISKDLDFYDRSLVHGSPPKLIWVRTGNCSTDRIETLLRGFSRGIDRFAAQPNESLLILP